MFRNDLLHKIYKILNIVFFAKLIPNKSLISIFLNIF